MNRTQPSFLKGLHPDADDFGLFSCEAHGRPNVTNFKDPTLEDAEVFVSRLTTPTVPLGAVGFRPRDRMAGRVVSSSLSSEFFKRTPQNKVHVL